MDNRRSGKWLHTDLSVFVYTAQNQVHWNPRHGAGTSGGKTEECLRHALDYWFDSGYCCCRWWYLEQPTQYSRYVTASYSRLIIPIMVLGQHSCGNQCAPQKRLYLPYSPVTTPLQELHITTRTAPAVVVHQFTWTLMPKGTETSSARQACWAFTRFQMWKVSPSRGYAKASVYS